MSRYETRDISEEKKEVELLKRSCHSKQLSYKQAPIPEWHENWQQEVAAIFSRMIRSNLMENFNNLITL